MEATKKIRFSLSASELQSLEALPGVSVEASAALKSARSGKTTSARAKGLDSRHLKSNRLYPVTCVVKIAQDLHDRAKAAGLDAVAHKIKVRLVS